MHHHGHHHEHTHGHHHGDGQKRLREVFFLNLIFAIFEFIGGLYTNSVSITSDALHDFGDALAILLALILEKYSHKKSSSAYSYGYRRFSTLSAVITGVILMVGSCVILINAIPRLIHPVMPELNGMLLISIVGLSVNLVAAYRASKGTSLNEKMIMWHMIEDVAGWGIVLVASIVMRFVDFPQLDAGLGIIFSLWILYNVFRNLKQAMGVFLMATPSDTPISKIEEEIKNIPNVQDVHHSHLWSLDGEQHVFTTHVVVENTISASQIDSVKKQIKEMVKNYGIFEATIEVEFLGDECVDPRHQA